MGSGSLCQLTLNQHNTGGVTRVSKHAQSCTAGTVTVMKNEDKEFKGIECPLFFQPVYLEILSSLYPGNAERYPVRSVLHL